MSDWSWAPFQEIEQEPSGSRNTRQRSSAQLQETEEDPFWPPFQESEDYEFWSLFKDTYQWPDYVTTTLKKRQEKGKPSLKKDDIDRLVEYGFYVTEDLGKGHEGQVYKAYVHIDLDFDIPVEPGSPSKGTRKLNLGGQACAIKRVGANYAQELDIIVQLKHPNCIQFYKFFEYGSGRQQRRYLVMQYLNGGTTFNDFILQFIAGKPKAKSLDDWTAQLIIKHAVLGLEYLHSLDIAHMDFHGANFMPHNESGKMIWKIVDFGHSLRKGEPRYKVEEDLYRFTMFAEKIVAAKGVSKDIGSKIFRVVDNVRRVVPKMRQKKSTAKNDLDTMEKICRALEPYFPPLVNGIEDEPPEDSVAYNFCNQFND